jgi:glycerate-2-kinase
MFIKNMEQLLPEDLSEDVINLRKIGLNCLEIAINSVKPENIIHNTIRKEDNFLFIRDNKYDLNQFGKIYIIGGGKATAEMAFTLERILKSFNDIHYEGIINVPEGLKIKQSQISGRIIVNYATHPIPNEKGLIGTKSMMNLIELSSKNDLIFCLISGGGSALLPLPKKGISLKDLQEINSLLLASGASIHEINTIRKHLSDFKGGNLAKYIFNTSGAKIISLIISDVIGDKLDSIASGPTVPDSTTFKDSIAILRKYGLIENISISVKKTLEQGLKDRKLENPKIKDPCFENVHNYLIGSVRVAVERVSEYLNNNDFGTYYFSDGISGESKDFAVKLFQIVSEKVKEKDVINKKRPIALIGTGELTVTIKGKGVGGRNQEMLLSFLDLIKTKGFNYKFLIIAANLDGIEGNSKAMGALIDNKILQNMTDVDLNLKGYLDNNDSNTFFKKISSEIITGPTGCNVNDLVLILISK